MRFPLTLVAVAAALAACRSAPKAPTRVATVEGFQTPESVLYDSALDVYFVSNINGNPSMKDNNGFISRVKPDGSIETLKVVEGGKNGVTLNAPKGLALRGDTIWVTDIDAARAFNARTGALVASVDLGPLGARFLNDPAFGPDGSLYITDTGIQFDEKGTMTHPGPDRIFKVAPDRKVSVAAQGPALEEPNGITWDGGDRRFLVVAFGGPDIFTWRPGDTAPTSIAKGPGGFDGVEVVGRAFFVSSWADSSVYRWQDGALTKVVTGVPSPADIGVDRKRNRLLIPIFTGNRIEIWQL
jgi:sugar lactone lactonase YvrE